MKSCRWHVVGNGSPYLGWVLNPHHSSESSSIVIDHGWLELWVDHRHWMETLGVPSPLMICKDGDVDFIGGGALDDWEEILEDAVDFSIHSPTHGSELGKYYGNAPPSGAQWPIMSSDVVSQIGAKVAQTKDDLLKRIQTEAIRRRDPSGLSELFKRLSELEFSEEDSIPLIYFQGGD